MLWWQGAPNGERGGSEITDLTRQADGGYRTDAPIHVAGAGKTLLRLHTGTSVQSVPIALPEDNAIPADAVPAIASTRTFAPDKRILQREARTDNVNLERAAYAVLAAIAVAWLAVLSSGLVRLDRRRGSTRDPVAAAPRDRPVTV